MPSKYDWDRIVTLYEKGHSTRAVADIVGCTISTVSRVLRIKGVSYRNRKGPPRTEETELGERIRTLRESGSTISDIAAQLDLHEITVNTALLAMGYRSRPRHGKTKNLDDRRADIIRLREQGTTWNQIADHLDVSDSTLRNWRHRSGLFVPIPRTEMRQRKAQRMISILRNEGPQLARDLISRLPVAATGLHDLMCRACKDYNVRWQKITIGPKRKVNIGDEKRRARLGTVVYMDNDRRLPAFIADRLPWRIDDIYEHRYVSRVLRGMIGDELAEATLSLLLSDSYSY